MSVQAHFDSVNGYDFQSPNVNRDDVGTETSGIRVHASGMNSLHKAKMTSEESFNSGVGDIARQAALPVASQ